MSSWYLWLLDAGTPVCPPFLQAQVFLLNLIQEPGPVSSLSRLAYTTSNLPRSSGQNGAGPGLPPGGIGVGASRGTLPMPRLLLPAPLINRRALL